MVVSKDLYVYSKTAFSQCLGKADKLPEYSFVTQISFSLKKGVFSKLLRNLWGSLIFLSKDNKTIILILFSLKKAFFFSKICQNYWGIYKNISYLYPKITKQFSYFHFLSKKCAFSKLCQNYFGIHEEIWYLYPKNFVTFSVAHAQKLGRMRSYNIWQKMWLAHACAAFATERAQDAFV